MEDLSEKLKAILIGQNDAVDAITPYIQMHSAGLAPEGRPIGVFLLLGPTGTGKTHTVEALAEVLHGHPKNLLKIDCGEFQMEHEVAKLIGAPPGYLGHRETQPMLNQARVNAAASESSPISLIIFDEIEKASPSLIRLLLGVLDKATLRLGDNSNVNFENSIIFLTSNLGAKAIRKATQPDFGFEAMVGKYYSTRMDKLQNIGLSAVKQKFSPEFVNRIDSIVTYRPLGRDDFELILDRIMEGLARLIYQRLGAKYFKISYTNSGKNLLLDKGTSQEFGARELKRTVQRHLIQPVAALASKGAIAPGSTVTITENGGQFEILLSE